MELGAIRGSPALAKTIVERLEFHRQSKCRGCKELDHVYARCFINPSRSLSIVATIEVENSISEKRAA